ncbi:MAG: PQQ-like beta-propeller repeat protein [Verrucomicrobia subdivision 3 bacterium]|nr:PQQ-like beta-propeller repeat protein [Limisphaerales bacterium]
MGVSAVFGSDWPQWRGPSRTGYAGGSAPELKSLPKEVKPIWKIDVGGGFSAPVVANSALIFLDESGGKEFAHRLDPATGKEIWRVDYAKMEKDEWGAGPRATPIIDGNRAYVQSLNGEFRCLDLANGKAIWQTSFEKDFGVKFIGSKANEGTASRRGNNGSGVIAADKIILPVGATDGASLVCFNKLDGKVLWKSGNDEAAYSSFVTATLAGIPQVVAFTADSLLGADLNDGKILWRVPLKTNAKRHAATPVIDGDNVIVNSHTIGMVALRISKDSGGVKATEAWVNKELKINLATPVLVDGHLYCQGANKDYICAEAATGKLKWFQAGFGMGRRDYSSTIVIGKNLLVLTEDGTLLLLASNPNKYTELGRQQVCGSTWVFPAYADGKLYVRDTRQLFCIDLAAR